MLTAIKEIGEFIRKKGQDLLSVLVENPNDNGKYVKVITINLKNDASYEKIDLEQFDSQKIMKYLYRKGPSGNGPNITPTAKITEINKTFGKKVSGWFKILDDNKVNLSDEERSFLQKIKSTLENNENTILNSISQKLSLISKKEKAILTIKIDNKYLGDINIFKKLLVEIEFLKDRESISNNKNCSVCGNIANSVSGKVDVFKFYTVDKPGFITGGFNKSLAWKNFPVCQECKLSLEEGKKFIESKKYNFYGLGYYLIPKFFFNIDEQILDIIQYGIKSTSLQKRTINRITNDEEEILDILKEEKDYLTLNFLFLKKDRSAERILLFIEDVFPSRLKKIFDVKDKVDKTYNTDELFTFANIRYFFEKSDKKKKEYDLDRYFLEIIDSVFKNKKIALDFLIKFFIKKIREELITTEYPYRAIENSLKNIIFFENLGLISFKEEVVEMSQFEELFKKFGSAFESPLKRGLFLLGVLTEMLLRKQYADKRSKPFLKQLKSLKMDEKDIKALLPKVQNKFQEYDAFDEGKRKIASEISNYLLTAGDNWKLSVDEINFYFSCGMNKADEVASIIYSKKEALNGKENQQ
ncbi:MAG: TIGR02556 family CRISPR-associated protein [Candidatus Omnitrophica bacterium]|nr:TIGR02556 family CRISPR-associated protein [Candidatus Omnitrophota bacterium]